MQTLSDKANVIVLLAHPSIEHSQMNAALAKAASEIEGVEVINIYDYPIDFSLYSEVLGNAKALVFQFPLYWLSAPSRLKQWTDEVFQQLAMEGLVKEKMLLVVTTTASEEAAYQHDGRNLFTMDEYLRPYQGTANGAGMIWHAPLVVYGNPFDNEVAKSNLQKGCKQYKEILKEMVDR